MTWRLSRFLLIASMVCIGGLSHAADAFYDYLADFYLHESHQARNPKQFIRYADGGNGVLLKVVLDPIRVKVVLSTYFSAVQRGESLPDVPKLLRPLLARYDGAFAKEPQTYEKEYLDSLEVSVELMTMAVQLANQSLLPPIANQLTGMEAQEQKALVESLQSMVTMARNMSAAALKALAADIRNKVSKGMLSDSGTKRALAIAERLAPS